MRWWCAAQGVPWEWSWRPYPGVWALLLLGAAGYLVLRRRGAASPASGPPGAHRARPDGPGRGVSFAAGLGLLWIALDWPVGALGAGYLVSVHMVQFLLVALAAPPLLLRGLPPAALRALVDRPALGPLLRVLTRPVAAILLFNLAVAVTHWPSAVDELMGSQTGSFLLDATWLGGGILFWWPVVCSAPERPRFPDPLKVGYLILNTVLVTVPFAFLTFGEFPFYAVYELAPRVYGIPARTDQRMAGLLMKLGGGAILWTAAAVLFFRWYRREEGSAAGSG